ncbi:MAG: sigma-70 family RNA polymerase sigma factor [Candidatus Niyogibacteria bacterium]|nr:sigma-70 family RNA polymerase sigma factor [Candidatus Niyogibacteria bacterium]
MLEQQIEEAKRENPEAFRAIFDEAGDRVFLYAASRTATREDALDIAQETFIDLWKALGDFHYRSDEEFWGFLFRIAKRKLAAYYRSQPAELSLDRIPEPSYDMEPQDHRMLLGQVNALKSNYQELLRLRYWSDMTFAQIASVMNIPEVTAKVWHHRAVKKLQANLNAHENVV